MTIDFSKEVDWEPGFDEEALAVMVIEGVLDYEDFPYESEVSLLITSADEIKKLNKEARGIDAPTDVLSFPMIDFYKIKDYDELLSHDDAFNPESGEALLGDIVICCEKVCSQAAEYGHSLKREYAFLIAHSMLHLLGYDHEDEDERRVMEERQSAILDGLGIKRE